MAPQDYWYLFYSHNCIHIASILHIVDIFSLEKNCEFVFWSGASLACEHRFPDQCGIREPNRLEC